MKRATSLKGILVVLMAFVIASIAARPQFMTSQDSFESEGGDGIEGRHFHRHHFRPYNHRQPFVGGHFGPGGGGMPFGGAGNFGQSNPFFGPTMGGGSSATGLGIANSGFGGGSAFGLGSANAGNGGATGIGIANAPAGGFGVGMGLGLAVSTPFGNMAQSQGQAISFG